MKIAVKGSLPQVEELKTLLPSEVGVAMFKNSELPDYDAIFDLDFDDDPQMLEHYIALKDKPVFLGAVKRQLENALFALEEKPLCHFIGMNTLPGFIHRKMVECTVLDEAGKTAALNFFSSFDLEVQFVESRVGMVTPRIICMIINEAYYTVQEGTASREDIDLGMKLGTAYPKGPFEWCEQIGLPQVFKTLYAMHEDTGDERYKICPLLKTEYLKLLQ